MWRIFVHFVNFCGVFRAEGGENYQNRYQRPCHVVRVAENHANSMRWAILLPAPSKKVKAQTEHPTAG